LNEADENFKNHAFMLGDHPMSSLGSLIDQANGNAIMSTPPHHHNKMLNKSFIQAGCNSTANNKTRGGMFTCTPKNEAF
jgi:hypothetical protein